MYLTQEMARKNKFLQISPKVKEKVHMQMEMWEM